MTGSTSTGIVSRKSLLESQETAGTSNGRPNAAAGGSGWNGRNWCVGSYFDLDRVTFVACSLALANLVVTATCHQEPLSENIYPDIALSPFLILQGGVWAGKKHEEFLSTEFSRLNGTLCRFSCKRDGTQPKTAFSGVNLIINNSSCFFPGITIDKASVIVSITKRTPFQLCF